MSTDGASIDGVGDARDATQPLADQFVELENLVEGLHSRVQQAEERAAAAETSACVSGLWSQSGTRHHPESSLERREIKLS